MGLACSWAAAASPPLLSTLPECGVPSPRSYFGLVPGQLTHADQEP